ncbi:hypothetical protein ACA910_012897 [Epithemia clementina (nom. ined.)]
MQTAKLSLKRIFIARTPVLWKLRYLSSNGGDDSAPSNSKKWSIDVEWRKVQLDRLEGKFSSKSQPQLQGIYASPPEITDDENLQPMWKNMESRVRNRIPRKVSGSEKTGRQNVKKTDEEIWLQEGLYSQND